MLQIPGLNAKTVLVIILGIEILQHSSLLPFKSIKIEMST